MIDHFESRIVKAISETMTCNKCPCPCKDKSSSTMYNCAKQWCYILSKIDPNVNWNEALDGVYAAWKLERERRRVKDD